MTRAHQHDLERSTQSRRTLAEWKEPLLVTFASLTIIVTGFVSYTYWYFSRIDQQQLVNSTMLGNETLEFGSGDPFENVTREGRGIREANPCEDDSHRSWETFNVSESELIYQLYPDENQFYLNRPQGPEFIVHNYVCEELKPFGTELFVRIFEELQSTYGFDRARELVARAKRSDNPWTWSEDDSGRYFVKHKNKVLSYVYSEPLLNGSSSSAGSSEEEWSNVRRIEFECPGVKVADDLERIEMGWMAVGSLMYLGRDAEILLEFSGAFRSINVWQTLVYDCIAKTMESVKNLEILSNCLQGRCVLSNCLGDDSCTSCSCTTVWSWPHEGLIGFKILHENGLWTLLYRHETPDESKQIKSNQS